MHLSNTPYLGSHRLNATTWVISNTGCVEQISQDVVIKSHRQHSNSPELLSLFYPVQSHLDFAHFSVTAVLVTLPGIKLLPKFLGFKYNTFYSCAQTLLIRLKSHFHICTYPSLTRTTFMGQPTIVINNTCINDHIPTIHLQERQNTCTVQL